VWWQTLREAPAWARFAAALLVVGVSAGVANLDVSYDGAGLRLRTGWMRPAAPPEAPAARVASDEAPWRNDLTALEAELRQEFRDRLASPATVRAAGRQERAPVEADVLRRVRTLLDESERRQQRELALRVAEVMRDVSAQRQSDLTRIDRSLGVIQSNTGVEVLRQRELLNYLVRVSQKQ
jgi:hypothetical protein